MPRFIKIEVTQEDIDRAIRSNSSRCVVAQAIARTLPSVTRISVDVQSVRFTDEKGVRRVYLTPAGVEQYVIGFDAGDKIEPFGFGLYETQRVNISRSRPTPKRAAKQKAQRKIAKQRQLIDDPSTTELARQEAIAELAVAEREYQDICETPGPDYVESKPDDPEVPHKRRARIGAGTKGAKSTERHYGHRVLRINQIQVDQTQS